MAERKEYWTTEDGQRFDTKEEAILHEKELKNPEYVLKNKIDELEKKIQHLEAENLKRISEIQAVKSPFGILNNKDTSPNINPYTQPNRVWYGVGQNLNEAFNNLKEVIDDR